ncbi:MAG TPA: DUF397 domain-containing protein [Pseudonocardiaceae bacterium]|jgi:hypothetical protein|nr:DUF397 domain-containing protein [Pseudonocardiaceae bacterium]
MDRSTPRPDGIAGWKRSSRCGPDGGNCVEVNVAYGDRIGVRDSADSAPRPVLAFGSREWRGFLTAAAGHIHD